MMFSQLVESLPIRNILEKFNGDNLVLYNRSKDVNFDKYFVKKELKFGNANGNMYGVGLYANLESNTKLLEKYSKKTIDANYGRNIFKFEVNSGRIFYFVYDYFKQSVLYKQLKKPTIENFIKAQAEHFGIKFTNKEYKQIDVNKNTNGQCAYNFFKAMSLKYYQRKDGTLNTPIAGFVYDGHNDGLTSVIWNPYELQLTAKSIDEGDWEPIDQLVAIKEYDENDEDVLNDIYDGKVTKDKKHVYRLLMAFKGEESPIGIFTNIKIYDDKTFDCKFISNLPQIDGHRQCLPMFRNEYFEEIGKLGFRMNKLDGWIKLGESKKDSEIQLLHPEQVKQMPPYEITEGVCLENITVDDAVLDALDNAWCKNKKLYLKNCSIGTLMFNDFKSVKIKGCKATSKTMQKNLQLKYKWAEDLKVED